MTTDKARRTAPEYSWSCGDCKAGELRAKRRSVRKNAKAHTKRYGHTTWFGKHGQFEEGFAPRVSPGTQLPFQAEEIPC